MSKMTEMKRELKKQEEREILEETSRRLEQAIELKKQGKDAEGDAVVDELKNWLEELIEEPEKSETSEKEQVHTPITVDRALLPQAEEVVAEGNKVILKVCSELEREQYLEVSYTYSIFKEMYKEDSFREQIWKEFKSEDSFVCSIFDKERDVFVGYCSIRSLAKPEWELAMELKKEFCHKGYGSEALPLLMEYLHKATGRRFFRARVEVDNRPSQKLVNKLGGYPNGVSEFMIHGEDITRFQQEHKDMITDDIRAVAEEFCMEPEDLLGYVLEYRFDMELDKGRK